MINFLKKIFYQPRRPFPITQPIAYQLKKDKLSKLVGIKPLSSIMYVLPKWRAMFAQLDINERIVEVPFVFQNLPQSKKTKILDVGSCETIMPIQLASLGYQVTGLDIRPYELQHPNFQFIQEDICHTTLPKNSFDIITCVSVIEHIGLDTLYGRSQEQTSDTKALQNMYKLLKPGGKLILTTPVAKKAFEQTGFMRIYTPTKLEQLLKKFNIIDEKYFSSNLNHTNWENCSLAKLPTEPNFGVAAIVAQKH